MPAKKRWITAVIAESKKPAPVMPFHRAAKRVKVVEVKKAA